MAHRGKDNAYGDLAERRAKMDAKYNTALEAELKTWITQVSGKPVNGDFQDAMKDGTILIALWNGLPATSKKLKAYSGGMAFKQMENISKFLEEMPAYGVNPSEVFVTADLFEGVNMSAVQTGLDALRRVAVKRSSGQTVESFQLTTSIALPRGDMNKQPKKAAKKVNPLQQKPGTFVKSTDNQAYGDLAERMAKMDAKYDPRLEGELRAWIESKTGQSIGADFQAGLANGTILCELVNKIRPGSVTGIYTGNMAFKKMENVNKFLDACRSFGVRSDDLFQTVYLTEGKNMSQVLTTLDNLHRMT